MKAGWRVVPLGEVCTVTKKQGGTRPLPYVGLEDIASGGAGSFSGSLDPQTDKSTTFEFEPGHVLYGRLRPYLNKVLLPDFVGHCSSEIFPLLPLPQLDRGFLFHWLTSQRTVDAINATCTGARMPRANVSELMTFPIPLPPLDEQKRIVAVLDEAFEGLSRARANAEANLADARELFAAALKAEFARSPDDWREVALSEIGATVTGSTPRTSDSGNLGGYLPFIKPGDFLPDGRLDYGNEGLSEKGAAVSRILPPGCALMVCIGATIGKAGYSEQKIATNQQINALVPSSGISGEFVYLQMISPDFQRDVLRNAGQATLPIINKSKWSALKVRVPKNLAWQHEITERMRSLRDVISELEARYSTAQEELATLRQSLLQKAFSGDLTR